MRTMRFNSGMPDWGLGSGKGQAHPTTSPNIGVGRGAREVDKFAQTRAILSDARYFSQTGSPREMDDLLAALHELKAPGNPAACFSEEELVELAKALSAGCRSEHGPPPLTRVRRALARLNGMDLAAGFRRPKRVLDPKRDPDPNERHAWQTVLALHAQSGATGSSLLRRLCTAPDLEALPLECQRHDRPLETFLDMACVLVQKNPGLSPHPATLIEQVSKISDKLKLPPNWPDALRAAQDMINFRVGDRALGKKAVSDTRLIALRKVRLGITDVRQQQFEADCGKLPDYIDRSEKKKSVLGKCAERLKIMMGGNKKPFEALNSDPKLAEPASERKLRDKLYRHVREMEPGNTTTLSSESKGTVSLDWVRVPLSCSYVKFLPTLNAARAKGVSIEIAHVGEEMRIGLTKSRTLDAKAGGIAAGGYGVEFGSVLEVGVKASTGRTYRLESYQDKTIGLAMVPLDGERFSSIDELRFRELVTEDLCAPSAGPEPLLDRVLLKHANLEFFHGDEDRMKTGWEVTPAKALLGGYLHTANDAFQIGPGGSAAVVGEKYETVGKKRHTRNGLEKTTLHRSTTMTQWKARTQAGGELRSDLPLQGTVGGSETEATFGKLSPFEPLSWQKTLREAKTTSREMLAVRRNGRLVELATRSTEAGGSRNGHSGQTRAPDPTAAGVTKTRSDAIANPVLKALMQFLPLQSSRVNTMKTHTAVQPANMPRR